MTISHQIAVQLTGPHRLDIVQARALVDQVLQAVAAAVHGGAPVILPGLGQFKTSIIAERNDRHPSTGASIHTPASRRLTFEPQA